jgi:hypothetical protein
MGNNIGPNGFYGFATELRLTLMIDQNHVACVWQFCAMAIGILHA